MNACLRRLVGKERTHVLFACVATLWATLLLGCGSSTGLSDGVAPGTFSLARYDGAALPVALSRTASVSPSGSTGASCVLYLTSMTIVLRANGEVQRTEALQTVCDDGRPVASSLTAVAGRVTWTGANFRFDFDALGFSPPGRYFGHVSGGTLFVDRREIDVDVITQSQPNGSTQTTFDLTPLTFERLP
jgi:hypothetical protein